MKPTIILISGKAEHGKNQSANYIKDFLIKDNKKISEMAFANKVKDFAYKYYNWNGKKDNFGRTLLQKIGEDVRKKDINFWVDSIIRDVQILDNHFDYFIITDTRYENEILQFKQLQEKYNIISLRIKRLNYSSSLSVEQLNHASEISLDNFNFDYYINVNNLEDLKNECIKFIKARLT